MRNLRPVWLAGLAAAFALTACNCGTPSNGPLTETAPGDLATRGLIIEQPADGATVSGAWVTVSGWFTPDAVQAVAVVGASVDGFYLPTGHVGVPTVPVQVRADGRFFAPRVPLQDGANSIVVLAFGKGGSTYQPITLTVNATDTATIPATVVVTPGQPEPGAAAMLRASTGDDLTTPFQWDFEGDGVFDVEGPTASHAFPAGRATVVARTKKRGQWISALTEVTVGTLPAVLKSASVSAPTRLFAIPRYLDPSVDAPENADGSLRLETRYLVAIDGDAALVFDADLNPLFSLPGLSHPEGVASDLAGRLYVADTGHDRLVRFTPQGALDPTFGTNGAYTGTTDTPIKAPRSIGYAGGLVLQDGNALLHCFEEAGPPAAWTCEPDDGFDPAELTALSVTTLSRFVTTPDPFVADARTPGSFIADEHLLERKVAGFHPTGLPAIDVAVGRSPVDDTFATLDPAGTIHVFQSAGHPVAAWKLPYPVTAIAAGPDGRLYVAGSGHLELRAFDPLR